MDGQQLLLLRLQRSFRLWRIANIDFGWKHNSEGDKIIGIEGDYYFFYGRTPERGGKALKVTALLRIEHHPTILMSWLKWLLLRHLKWTHRLSRIAKRRRTRLRLLAPLSCFNILDLCKKWDFNGDPFDLFNRRDFHDQKDELFDIRGDVYFNRDYCFTECEGINNFENLNHIGYKSRTGFYKIFFLMGAFLDWQGRPTATECICAKRRYIDDASVDQKTRFFNALEFLRRDGIFHQYSEVMSPILLPSEDAAANDILPKLRALLNAE